MTTIITLSAIGIVAVIAELVLPGGILGIIGAICMVVAVVMTFLEYGMTAGILATVALGVIGFSALVFWMKNFHRLPVTKRFVLNDEVGEDDALEQRQTWVGRTGVALTDLVPSGRARIGDEPVDVMAESGYIAKDTPVEVISTSGPSIFVRARETGDA